MRNDYTFMRSIFFFVILFILFSLAFKSIAHNVLYVDEGYHLDQITGFTKGDFGLSPIIQTLPGYYLFIAALVKPFFIPTKESVRTLAFLINLFVIPLFYLLARRIDARHAMSKTIQFSFLPIVFPYYFLIYSDIFSLILLFISLYFLLNRRYYLSGIVVGISLFIRQTNIIWLAFYLVVLFYDDKNRFNRKQVLLFFKKSIFFFIGALSLFVFFFFSKRIAMGDSDRFPIPHLWSGFSNIYLFFITAFIIFLPFQIASVFRVVKLVRRQKWIGVLLIVLFPLYLYTFINDHPFNQSTWFIHNLLAITFTRDLLMKSFGFIIAAYAALSLITTPLQSRRWYLLYPAVVLALLPHWLIELRYSIEAFSFFLLVRKTQNQTVEIVQTLWFILLSVILFIGIVRLEFFL